MSWIEKALLERAEEMLKNFAMLSDKEQWIFRGLFVKAGMNEIEKDLPVVDALAKFDDEVDINLMAWTIRECMSWMG